MATDIRLDEADGNWVVMQARIAKVEGTDIMLDAPDRRAGHGGEHRRALVHDGADGLTLNFNNDYAGGVTINSARINLQPITQVDDKLPLHGKVGDLVLMRSTVKIGRQVVTDSCSLWLCVPSVVLGGGASWCEITMGSPVRGSE